MKAAALTIPIPQPALGLNSHNTTLRVRMWNTGFVPASASPAEVAEWILRVARSAPGGRLASVVMSAHGNAGWVALGRGFGIDDLPVFSRLVQNGRPLVGTFYLTACLVARIASGSGGINAPQTCISSADGNAFCSRFAQITQARVIAATETQTGDEQDGWALPFGVIDEYEGLVLTYGPTGALIDSRRTRSGAPSHRANLPIGW